MRRTRAEVDHAIEVAATHGWEGHAWQGMYERLGIGSERQLRQHVTTTVWGTRTECFIATYDREIYYDRITNTLVILNYRTAGTCLVSRAGPRGFERRYERETDRYAAIGIDLDAIPKIVSGGVRALHPAI